MHFSAILASLIDVYLLAELRQIFSTWFIPDQSILVMFGSNCNPDVISLLMMSILEERYPFLIYAENVVFSPEENEYLERPPNILLCNINPERLRRNAFFHAQSKMLYVDQNSTSLISILHLIWWNTRSLYLAGVNLATGEMFAVDRDYKNSCNSSNIITLLPASNKVLKTVEMFQSRTLNDFKYCPLMTMSQMIVPYVQANRSLTEDALEMKILAAVAEKLRLSIVHVPDPTTGKLYDPIVNGTLNGCVKSLYYHTLDVCFGGLYAYTHQPYYIDNTIPHFNMDLMWFGYLPKHLNAVHYLYLGFNSSVWILVLVTSLAFLTFLWVSTRTECQSISSIVLFVFAACLNMSSNFSSRHMINCICMLFYFYTLCITALYQSSMYSLLSSAPTTAAIDTMQKAVDNNKLISILYFHQMLVFNSTTPLTIQLAEQKNFKVVDEPQIVEDSFSDDIIVMLDRLIGIYHFKSINRTRLLLKPYFYTAPTSFLLSPDSPYKGPFDKTITQLREGGFIKKWEKELEFPPEIMLNNERRPLEVSDLLGGLFILIILHSVSSMFFIFELTSKHFRRKIAFKQSTLVPEL